MGLKAFKKKKKLKFYVEILAQRWLAQLMAQLAWFTVADSQRPYLKRGRREGSTPKIVL